MQTPTTRDDDRERPWTREPMVWLILVLPVLAVIGSVTSAVLAAKGADPEVAEEVRHDGLAINRDPTRDRAAAALGVEATVTTGGGALRVHLTLPPSAGTPGTLSAMLSHATLGNVDQRISLAGDGAGNFTGALTPLVPGHWYVEISPPDRGWRLTGDFTGAADNLVLRPRSGP